MREEELYSKFPAVLKRKLLNKELKFPSNTEFEYEKIYVYRAVKREKDDNTRPNANDFKSYFEEGKRPKAIRGKWEDCESNPRYYGVSSFLKREIVEQLMRFPNPRKKMMAGYVCQEGGPQETNLESQHVCWWLYENADISGFEIIE